MLQTTHPHDSIPTTQINSETDFVARNPQFLQLVGDIAASALSAPLGEDGKHVDMQALHAATLPSGSRY